MNKIKLKVNFDICTFCNHACSFCSNPDERTVKNMTSLEGFEKTMDNVMSYVTTSELGLSAKGEVFLNKNLSKIIDLSKTKYNIPYVYLSTNGALCNEEKINEVLDSGLDSIKFSINAIDKITYKTVHKRDDFTKVIENFKTLLEYKRKTYPNLKIFISSVLQDVSEQELKEEFQEIFGKNFNLIDNIWYYPLGFTSKLNVEYKENIVLPKCKVPFKEIWINSDCTLGLCCKDYFDEINFGSLLEHDFLSIYKSKKFVDIREMHRKSIFKDEGKLCEKCLMYGF